MKKNKIYIKKKMVLFKNKSFIFLKFWFIQKTKYLKVDNFFDHILWTLNKKKLLEKQKSQYFSSFEKKYFFNK